MANILDTIFGQTFGGKPIAGSGISNLKGAVAPTIATITAPVALGSGIISSTTKAASPIVSSVSKNVASSITKTIAANPIKSAVVGLVGFGAVKENPKLISEVPSKTATGLVSIGENIGQLSKNPSVSGVLDIYKDNPVLATGITALAVGTTGKIVAPLVSSYLQTSSIRDLTEEISNKVPEPSILSGVTPPSDTQKSNLISNQLDVPQELAKASPSYPEPNTQLVSYSDKKLSTYKRKQTKTLNKSPTIIRNTILIANKNG